MSTTTTTTEKKSHAKQATGLALKTTQEHAEPNEFTLYGSCFCPFVQRVWTTLELKGMPYRYYEIDPYAKPKELLDVNPRGLVPAIKHGDWACNESSVLLEYLEDVGPAPHILPPQDPKMRAKSRLWSDHISKKIIPAFYQYLQDQNRETWPEKEAALGEQLQKIVDAADPEGPFFLGKEMTLVDIMIMPWAIRGTKVLGHYKGWKGPEPGSRLAKWWDAIINEPSVKKTTSDDQLYIDSYERYAENRPGTSEVQKAISEGKALP